MRARMLPADSSGSTVPKVLIAIDDVVNENKTRCQQYKAQKPTAIDIDEQDCNQLWTADIHRVLPWPLQKIIGKWRLLQKSRLLRMS
jgi:hypothetical protein